jgi:MFS family permease
MVSQSSSDWRPYSIYTLSFLSLISAFNYMDRSILALAMPAIKIEMHLSDTALGLVYGSAFAVFYAIFGIPIAWAADRGNRRKIIAFGFAFWSVMTALTGVVTNVWQLAASRFLMGCGEACCVPPAHSMIADLFRKDSRALAMAIFGTAYSVAYAVFYPLAGWLITDFGWRTMFIAAGLPGVLLAAVFLVSVREPQRVAADKAERASGAASLFNTVIFLLSSRTYLLLLLASMFMGANIYATSAWFPTFLSRVHGLSLLQVGSYIGPLRGVLGAVGILGGGWLADRMGRRDPRWRLWVPAVGCFLLGPAEALFLIGDRRAFWIVGLALTSLLSLVHQAPAFAAAMGVAKAQMRAVASSVLVFCAAVVGQIAGPLLIGALNDRLTAVLGKEAIRYSLLVVAVCSVAAGFAFLLAAKMRPDQLEQRLVSDGAR